jgi:hypothetical protein
VTAIERALALGFRTVIVPQGGVSMRADTGETFTGVIEDIPALDEPGEIAKSKTPIYANIEADSDDIENPHTVKTITETVSGRTHRVLKFIPQAADRFTVKWLVETQRT